MRVWYRWGDESEFIAKDFVEDEFATPTVPGTVPHPHLLPSMLTCCVMGCEQTLLVYTPVLALITTVVSNKIREAYSANPYILCE